jgi:hypothetical protein
VNPDRAAIEIVDRTDGAAGVAFTMDWLRDEANTIRFVLASGPNGVELRFGPTAAVAGWPAWLRGVAAFGEDGAAATIWLDPLREGEPGAGITNAVSLKGGRSGSALASFSSQVADALKMRCADPSPDESQAIETCAGLSLAFADLKGIAPALAPLPNLFCPSQLPILIDDINGDPARQHVRLTYRLPRLDGRWTDGCSLRLFQSERMFGIEFRALSGDHLPRPLLPACVYDDLGPLMRFSIDRAGRGTEMVGKPDNEGRAALRLVRAIARQVSNDLAPGNVTTPIPGFEAPYWKHWLAALPDLLATRPAEPLVAA